ncbi:putative esterase [Psilocybe cubensis]|uniref:Esterase n=2 Tax=Psilocybe cubensis TaxID=181762 RepID=A0ACB8GUR3_PSICU|nr:putative esterase [Psilocybe cubensis]KAH9479263.1 putative esterase [Psilocybe cubensis]
MSGAPHLHDELANNPERVTVETAFGPVIGGRAQNGSAIFLEIPYALPPGRFEDPVALPSNYRYDKDREYIRETTYGVQPLNDGQAADMPFKDKVGYGEPSENPLFLNIAIPPTFPEVRRFPVRVYIHGGFLQFGSPHTLGSQAQYIAAERSEIWVNVGYRLSAFGFIACDKPKLTGNYGFKDQWVALEWIKANIEAFGGNPNDIQITGLSAGAHSVHQLLHHASLLPEGKKAPFNSAVLQSNAMLTDPKTPEELRPQFIALCEALGLDPEAPDVLNTLKDPSKISWQSITKVIETDAIGHFGTFRGCLSEDWISVNPGPMEWQRCGGLSRGLRTRGVSSIVVGDLIEEWYLYSIAHPIKHPEDILPNLERYMPTDLAQKLLEVFPKLPPDAGAKDSAKLYGDILSCTQVHLPARLLAKDLEAQGYPIMRYEIRWTPEKYRPLGYVTHGCDRLLWALRIPSLEPVEVDVAKEWIENVSKEVEGMNAGESCHNSRLMLTLKEDKSIGWTTDEKWEDLMKLEPILESRKGKFGVAPYNL